MKSVTTAWYLSIVIWFLRMTLHKIIPGNTGKYECIITLSSGYSYCYAEFNSVSQAQKAVKLLENEIARNGMAEFVICCQYKHKTTVACPSIWNSSNRFVKNALSNFPRTVKTIKSLSSMLGQERKEY